MSMTICFEIYVKRKYSVVQKLILLNIAKIKRYHQKMEPSLIRSLNAQKTMKSNSIYQAEKQFLLISKF